MALNKFANSKKNFLFYVFICTVFLRNLKGLFFSFTRRLLPKPVEPVHLCGSIDDDDYSMSSISRGTCLIFNHKVSFVRTYTILYWKCSGTFRRIIVLKIPYSESTHKFHLLYQMSRKCHETLKCYFNIFLRTGIPVIFLICVILMSEQISILVTNCNFNRKV